MEKLIILGSTSNICANRVFNNLNNLNYFKTIICYGYEKWTTDDFITKHFFKNVVLTNKDKISKKIKFISGEYNLESYRKNLLKFVTNNTIIYVSTPPICYTDILNFNKILLENITLNLILEKPLCLNLDEYQCINKLLEKNVIVSDHFIYKNDIIKLFNYKEEIKKIEVHFLYTDDVENRLGYFDKVGFFLDMFQSHFMSIIYKINDSLISKDLKIKKNIRKRYENYGGKNNIDTYFYVEYLINGVTLIFEAGKAMKTSEDYIIINSKKYEVLGKKNEYYNLFKDVIDNKIDYNYLKYQEKFWEITDIIANDYNDSNHKMEIYKKNSI